LIIYEAILDKFSFLKYSIKYTLVPSSKIIAVTDFILKVNLGVGVGVKIFYRFVGRPFQILGYKIPTTLSAPGFWNGL
jgi:hypothetical protein